LPVRVANDANAAALGEVSARGAGCKGDLIFVELGRGVGAGLVLDGRLREGPGFGAGEIGYMVLDRAGASAAGGPGWLEAAMDLESFWSESDRDGRPSAAAVERVGGLLARGAANLCIALDVRTVVLGRAGREAFGPGLLAVLRRELATLCPMDVSCELSVAAEPGVSGAAGLALDEWMEGVCAG
ncbi:MAG: ROK family protein, partial [Spirochaetes bacterium]|nr:ROK family protein [Spirochaetota bacterium]